MNIKSILALAVLVGISFINTASANPRCGIGTKIWGKGKSVSSQSSEQSTNNVSLNTVSITFGTSGCKASGFVLRESEIKYAAANLEELTQEMAEGQGEILNSFMEVLGCESGSRLQKILKKNFSQVVPDVNQHPIDFLVNVKTQIKKDEKLSAICGPVV